jgi:hypothetical protein
VVHLYLPFWGGPSLFEAAAASTYPALAPKVCRRHYSMAA